MTTIMRTRNSILVLVLAVVMIATAYMPAFAEGEPGVAYSQWVYASDRSYYYNADGQAVASVKRNTRNKWVNADGKRFYFTKKRRAAGPGFRLIKKKLYYFNEDGSLVYGAFEYNGEIIQTTPSGNIVGLPYYKYCYKKFVYIDISDQQLEYYKKGQLMMRCPVVTGNPGRGWRTPTGNFKVRHKGRNVRLINGKSVAKVTYWMAFIRNEYGMHDASWRGAKDYRTNETYTRRGSHGCVNMRYHDAAYLYSQVRVGTPVIIVK